MSFGAYEGIGKLSCILLMCTSMMGSGLLSIPLLFHNCGAPMAILLIIANALSTIFSVRLLLGNVLLCDVRNYYQVGLHAFGNTGGVIVELNMFLIQFGQICAYLIIIEDVVSTMLKPIVHSSPTLSFIIMAITCLILFPVSYIKSSKTLTSIALFSVLSYAFFGLAVISAALFDWKARGNRRTGVFYRHPMAESIFVSIPMICLAFSCQSNFFWIFNELRNPTSRKMVSVTQLSVAITAFLYILVGIFGAMAFGHEVEGNLLINMHGHWMLEVSSFAMLISTLLSFPFVMNPCIISLDSFLFLHRTGIRFTEYQHHIPSRRFAIEVSVVLFFSLLASHQSHHVEIFLSVTGALSGYTVGYILPCLFYLKVTSLGTPLRSRSKLLVVASLIFAILSVVAIVDNSNANGMPKDKALPAPRAAILTPVPALPSPTLQNELQHASEWPSSSSAPKPKPTLELPSVGHPSQVEEQPTQLPTKMGDEPSLPEPSVELEIAGIIPLELEENPFAKTTSEEDEKEDEEGDRALYEQLPKTLEELNAMNEFEGPTGQNQKEGDAKEPSRKKDAKKSPKEREGWKPNQKKKGNAKGRITKEGGAKELNQKENLTQVDGKKELSVVAQSQADFLIEHKKEFKKDQTISQ